MGSTPPNRVPTKCWTQHARRTRAIPSILDALLFSFAIALAHYLVELSLSLSIAGLCHSVVFPLIFIIDLYSQLALYNSPISGCGVTLFKVLRIHSKAWH